METDSHFVAAFDELAALAYRTAYRVLGSRRDAEDVAQETMTRALLRWRQIADHARPWICRVAANLAIDKLRRQSLHRAWLRRREPALELTSPDHTSVDRVELQRVLMALPRRQREVLVLRYLADFTEMQVANELGLTQSSVKTHAKRALATLRLDLTEAVPPQETDDVRTP